MKPAKTLSRGTYTLKSGKIVQFERVELYDAVYNKKTDSFTDTAALVVWVDENGRFPKTMIRGDQFKEFYRLGGL